MPVNRGSQGGPNHSPAAAQRMAEARMLEIAIGILVGLWWAGGRRKKRAAEMTAVAFQAALEGRWAYWLEDGVLVRAPMTEGQVDVSALEAVDPLHSEGVTPVEVIEILNALDPGRSSRQS